MHPILCVYCRWANQQQLIGSDGKLHGFQHPVVFTLLMFLGEFLCFAVFKLIRLSGCSSQTKINKNRLAELDSAGYLKDE